MTERGPTVSNVSTHHWADTALRAQRCELSRMVEPGDAMGPVMIQALGLEATHRLVTSGSRCTAEQQRAVLATAAAAGLGTKDSLVPRSLERWRTRLAQANWSRDSQALHRIGGGFLTPEDSAWPAGLNELYPHAPLGLYFRGPEQSADPYHVATARLPLQSRTIAIVGSREMTDYGARVTAEISEELSSAGVTVLSGGAYGVDAAAHRAALRQAPPPKGSETMSTAPTIAVLAGGLDRLYPAGNERLLRSIMDHGLILSEMAPGSSPTRHRFLQRNRLIAALAASSVVIEARWRSGALSTAHHALSLGRPVGAVPGSVHSASSAGCHRLLRETPAELVTDAASVLELIVAQLGHAQQPLPLPGAQNSTAPAQESAPQAPTPGLDQLSDLDLRVYDALPLRQATTVGRLSAVAGLSIPQLLGALTRLNAQGLAVGGDGQWKRGR